MYTEPLDFTAAWVQFLSLFLRQYSINTLTLHLHCVRHYKQLIDDWLIQWFMLAICTYDAVLYEGLVGFCICKDFWNLPPYSKRWVYFAAVPTCNVSSIGIEWRIQMFGEPMKTKWHLQKIWQNRDAVGGVKNRYFLFNIVFYLESLYAYVSVWVCAHECRALRDRSGTCSYRWLWSHPMWVLRTELQSFAREECALSGWAVFSSPLLCYWLQESKSLSQSGSDISR